MLPLQVQISEGSWRLLNEHSFAAASNDTLVVKELIHHYSSVGNFQMLFVFGFVVIFSLVSECDIKMSPQLDTALIDPFKMVK